MSPDTPTTRCPQCGKSFAATVRICPEDGTVLEHESLIASQVGQVLDGKYRLEAFLSEGGMGAVYRAAHVMLGKTVAVKLIKPELVTSPDVVRRFQREARAATALNHPNIVAVYDLGQTPDGTLYIAMEFVNGPTLKSAIERGGPMAPARIVSLLRQVASALSVAHRHGIVHRDLKPHNIMLAPTEGGGELPKLVDFGIAKTFDDATQLTMTGFVMGTPHYMAPEQAEGRAVDGRSDLYSLGIIMYEMLTGQVPFSDTSAAAILIKHMKETPVPPSVKNPGLSIPPSLEAVTMRCLDKDPALRFQSADEFAAALEQAAASVPGVAEAAQSTVLIMPGASTATMPGAAPWNAATLAGPPSPLSASVSPTAGVQPLSPPGASPTARAQPPSPSPASADTRATALGSPALANAAAVPPATNKSPLVLVLIIVAALAVGAGALYLRGRGTAGPPAATAPAAEPPPAASPASALANTPVPAPEPPPAAQSTPAQADRRAAPTTAAATPAPPSPAAPRAGNVQVDPPATKSSGETKAPAPPPTRSTPPAPASATPVPAPASVSAPPLAAPAPASASAPPPAPAPPSPVVSAPRATASATPPPAAAPPPPRRSEESAGQAPPAVMPQNPAVFFHCAGPQEICSALKTAVDDALDKAGLGNVRNAARADVDVAARVEGVQERADRQFGTTFTVRTYSIDLNAEAPRTGDAVSMPPSTSLSFDPQFGAERVAEKARLLAGEIVDRVKAFAKKKRGG